MIKNRKFILGVIVLILGLGFAVSAKPKRQYVFKMMKPTESVENIFKDETIEAGFVFAVDGVNFVLNNKSEQPIKIRWNDVSYIDAAGNAHRVIHSGIKYDERNQEMPAVSVPPSSKITDVIVPTEYVFLDSGGFGAQYYGRPPQWRVTPFFPSPDKKEALSLDGRVIEVFMPIETSDGVKNYRFTFQINLVEIVKKKKT